MLLSFSAWLTTALGGWMICPSYTTNYRSQWPRGLRRRSAAAWLLGSRVRIPLEACMFICYVVLCRQRSLRRADHSTRTSAVSLYVWSQKPYVPSWEQQENEWMNHKTNFQCSLFCLNYCTDFRPLAVYWDFGTNNFRLCGQFALIMRPQSLTFPLFGVWKVYANTACYCLHKWAQESIPLCSLYGGKLTDLLFYEDNILVAYTQNECSVSSNLLCSPAQLFYTLTQKHRSSFCNSSFLHPYSSLFQTLISERDCLVTDSTHSNQQLALSQSTHSIHSGSTRLSYLALQRRPTRENLIGCGGLHKKLEGNEQSSCTWDLRSKGYASHLFWQCHIQVYKRCKNLTPRSKSWRWDGKTKSTLSTSRAKMLQIK
jgi:hypothetical protein